MIIVIYGPSGGGKTTIKNELIARGWNDIKSYTTRQPRLNNCQEYHYITEKEFKHLHLRNEMINVNCYCGEWYGIKVQDFLNNQYQSVMVSDVNSLKKLSKEAKLHGIKLQLVYAKPPSLNSIKNRHKKRGTENRISVALNEINYFYKNGIQQGAIFVSTENLKNDVDKLEKKIFAKKKPIWQEIRF